MVSESCGQLQRSNTKTDEVWLVIWLGQEGRTLGLWTECRADWLRCSGVSTVVPGQLLALAQDYRSLWLVTLHNIPHLNEQRSKWCCVVIESFQEIGNLLYLLLSPCFYELSLSYTTLYTPCARVYTGNPKPESRKQKEQQTLVVGCLACRVSEGQDSTVLAIQCICGAVATEQTCMWIMMKSKQKA